MTYLIVIFASPIYFLIKGDWLGFFVNSLFYGTALLLLVSIIGAVLAPLTWILAVGHGTWALRRQLMEEQATVMAQKMAEAMAPAFEAPMSATALSHMPRSASLLRLTFLAACACASLLLQGCGRLSAGPSAPDKKDLMAAASQMAKATLGGNTKTFDTPMMFEVEDVSVNGTSQEGAACRVLASVRVRLLPGFYESTLVRFRTGFYAWIPAPMTIGSAYFRGDQQFVRIDEKWKAEKNAASTMNLVDVTLHFRKYDTGWRFEKGD